MLINRGEINDKYYDGSKIIINGVIKRRRTFMGSITGISATGVMWNSDNKSTTTSSDNQWAKELQKVIDGNGTSSSSSSSKSDGSKTTIERTVVMGPDGSMTVTLTQITTAQNGTQSSKVISTTKTGGTAAYNASEKSGKDALADKTQMQGSMLKNNLVSSAVSNEYDKNSDTGAYLSGAVFNKD